jgi:prefoldin subunit 5
MKRIQIKHFLAGSILSLSFAATGLAQSTASRPSDVCESAAPKAQFTLIDLEIVMRAEQRVEAMRAKLADLQMQELELLTRLDDLEYLSTPDGIQRALNFVGSVRPMDELRSALRTRIEGEKARVNKQLEFLATSRERLESAIREADADVERVRQRMRP